MKLHKNHQELKRIARGFRNLKYHYEDKKDISTIIKREYLKYRIISHPVFGIFTVAPLLLSAYYSHFSKYLSQDIVKYTNEHPLTPFAFGIGAFLALGFIAIALQERLYNNQDRRMQEIEASAEKIRYATEYGYLPV